MGLFGLGSSNSSSAPTSFSAKKKLKLNRNADGIAAVNFNTIEEKGGVSLRKKSEAVAVSLRKRNISGIRAQVVLVLDHSYSMMNDYNNGKVQQLVERFLAFGLNVDEDGTIPVVPFDSRVKKTVDVTLSNYSDVVNKEIFKPNDMGGTDLAAALRKVKKIVEQSDSPVYVGIVTDGEPNSREDATAIVKDLSQYPVFIKFIAIQNVRYLQDLDDMSDSQRLLDNVDSKYFPNVQNVSDEEFAEAMADEWDSWTKAATAAGVLE